MPYYKFKRKVQRDERDVIILLRDLQLSGCSILPYTLILPEPSVFVYKEKKTHIDALIGILISKDILLEEPYELFFDELDNLDNVDFDLLDFL